jgi:hypothetical protein
LLAIERAVYLRRCRARLDAANMTRLGSSCDFAGLKNVDGFGELPGAPRAAAEFAQDAPGLELGVGAFTGTAQPGMRPVGVLL